MGVRSDEQPYRFDDLGSLQFERLCFELVATFSGVATGEWRRTGRGCEVLLPEGIAPPGGGTLAGPTLALVAWVRAADAPAERLRLVLEQTLALSSERKPRSFLVLTNVPAPEFLIRDVGLTILGSRELSELVAASWPVRLHAPSVLGIGAADDLAAPEAAGTSSADLEAARALAPVFVPTRGYAAAVDVLEQHHFVVLTGPPEMGKTAIARTVGLAALTDGWEVHECVRPDELWARFRRDRRQVFIADDAFGSTEYRPEAAERWSLDLDRILHALDDTHWLLWTSRPAPLKAGLRRIHREHGVERFPQPAHVQVDAADLDVAEKALVLFRHAKSASLPPDAVELVQAEGWAIVSHPHFTPERIRRFVSTRLVELSGRIGAETEIDAAVAAEIREPTEAMAASFRALSDEHRALLVALLDTPPGPVAERDLVAAFRRHSDAGLARHPAELVDRLTDHFVRLVDGKSVTWVHPSWRDLVIEQVSADPAERQRFLGASSLDGLLLALSTAGGAAGERDFPLIRADADWDVALDRFAQLIPELAEPDLTRLFIALDEAEAASTEDLRGEVDHLVYGVLSLVAQRWARGCTPIAVGVLQSWFELATSLPDPPSAPELAATWIELAPTQPIDLDVQEEIVRLDDWTALCALVRSHQPDALAGLGFPQKQIQFVDAFVAAVEAVAADPAALPAAQRELLAGILRRLTRLGATSEEPFHVLDVADRLSSVHEEPELPATFTPRPISPELEEIIETATARPRSDEALVARVLRDL